MPALTTGDTVPRPQNAATRTPWHRWHQLFQAEYDTVQDAAPAYVQGWGRVLAGLMQAEPVAYTEPVENPPLSSAQLADLTDDAVLLSSGEGVAYCRFVSADGRWMPMVIGTNSVDATWRNNQMVDAVVFKVLAPTAENTPTGQSTLVYLEEYGLEGEGSFKASVRSATRSAHGWTLGDELEPSEDAGNEFQQMLTLDGIQTPRPLIPDPWSLRESIPVPVYVGNEQAVFGLARLWTQEQEDAEIIRRRIFVHEKMVQNQGSVFYGADGRTQLINAGFTRDNVVALKSGGSANDPSTGGIDTMEFSDSLTMRDRIERRENSLLEQIGIAPQSIGRNVTGRSDSGASKRADQQMTLTTIAGPARKHEAWLTQVAAATAELNGGVTAPVDVREGLKQSTQDLTETVNTARMAQAMSTRTAVRTLNPSWDADQVDVEVGEIIAENPGMIAPEF